MPGLTKHNFLEILKDSMNSMGYLTQYQYDLEKYINQMDNTVLNNSFIPENVLEDGMITPKECDELVSKRLPECLERVRSQVWPESKKIENTVAKNIESDERQKAYLFKQVLTASQQCCKEKNLDPEMSIRLGALAFLRIAVSEYSQVQHQLSNQSEMNHLMESVHLANQAMRPKPPENSNPTDDAMMVLYGANNYSGKTILGGGHLQQLHGPLTNAFEDFARHDQQERHLEQQDQDLNFANRDSNFNHQAGLNKNLQQDLKSENAYQTPRPMPNRER